MEILGNTPESTYTEPPQYDEDENMMFQTTGTSLVIVHENGRCYTESGTFLGFIKFLTTPDEHL